MKKPTATLKYLAFDVHQATCTYTVRNSAAGVMKRGVVTTCAHDLVALVRAFGPNLHVAFEEGTQAQWLHDLLLPHCAKVIVCDPRATRSGVYNKDDRIDPDLLSDLLVQGALRPVFHGSPATKPLKELVRAYTALVLDSIRVMLRIKAIYRGRAIAAVGEGVYRPALRKEWLEKISEPAARRRAELFFAQLDTLSKLRSQAKRAMLCEASKHPVFYLLQSFPCVGPIRAAEIIAIIGSPFRFRTKRGLWPYSGLAVVHQSTSDHVVIAGRIERRKRQPLTRGLNQNYNRTLKKVFKAIAVDLSSSDTPLGEAHRRRLAGGMRKEMALLTLARSVASVLLSMWKKGVPYDPKRLTSKMT